MTERDAYSVLQVACDADHFVLAAAYRALARRFHPDVVGPSGTEQMVATNAAWDAVRTPERRAAYDRSRRAASPPPSHRQADAHDATVARSAQAPDPASYWRQPAADGTGAAGPPPGRPSGRILPFGRHIGWSLGEVARVDPGYLEWLVDRPDAAAFRSEILALLERMGRGQETSRQPIRRGFLSRS